MYVVINSTSLKSGLIPEVVETHLVISSDLLHWIPQTFWLKIHRPLLRFKCRLHLMLAKKCGHVLLSTWEQGQHCFYSTGTMNFHSVNNMQIQIQTNNQLRLYWSSQLNPVTCFFCSYTICTSSVLTGHSCSRATICIRYPKILKSDFWKTPESSVCCAEIFNKFFKVRLCFL